MSSIRFNEVRQLALFSDMENANFDTLMRGAYVQTFPPHVQLITEGDQSDFLHILVSGSVELYASWAGRKTSMATVRPVSTFILAATIRDAPYLMSASTTESSRIVLVPSQDVRDHFDKDAAFARTIVAELAQCYRSVIRATKDLKLRTSLERLANYILREQGRAGGKDSFDLGMEKRRLASLLGMTPENLSRSIKALRPHGVTMDGSTVTILDQKDLERFAKPDVLIDDQTR